MAAAAAAPEDVWTCSRQPFSSVYFVRSYEEVPKISGGYRWVISFSCPH